MWTWRSDVLLGAELRPAPDMGKWFGMAIGYSSVIYNLQPRYCSHPKRMALLSTVLQIQDISTFRPAWSLRKFLKAKIFPVVLYLMQSLAMLAPKHNLRLRHIRHIPHCILHHGCMAITSHHSRPQILIRLIQMPLAFTSIINLGHLQCSHPKTLRHCLLELPWTFVSPSEIFATTTTSLVLIAINLSCLNTGQVIMRYSHCRLMTGRKSSSQHSAGKALFWLINDLFAMLRMVCGTTSRLVFFVLVFFLTYLNSQLFSCLSFVSLFCLSEQSTSLFLTLAWQSVEPLHIGLRTVFSLTFVILSIHL